MPDNPAKKGRDAKTVSKQPHEQAYQKSKLKKNISKGGGGKTTTGTAGRKKSK